MLVLISTSKISVAVIQQSLMGLKRNLPKLKTL
jgi:hypothetical protein